MRTTDVLGRTVSLAVVAGALALASCAGAPRHADSGFLGDTSFLHAGSDSGAREWFDPSVDFDDCCRLVIDPVQVVLVPGAEAAALDPALLSRLAGEFRATLVRVVDPYYDVLDAPAPRTIRVRVALTDVRMRPGGTSAADLAAVRVEWEALDATTGRRIGAGVRWREARDDAPGFEASALALLDLMNCRRDLGTGAASR